MRGNRPGSVLAFLSRRSIPACAGEPRSWPIHPLATQVYPRVCGGTEEPEEEIIYLAGLSPRVRGNRPCMASPANAAGSIPACAGEPCMQIARSSITEVYPRVCGGTPSQSRASSSDTGLSPRVRGNLGLCQLFTHGLRSIPACAGEPPVLASDGLKLKVYPRVCGGTSVPSAETKRRSGLSPRVRGNPNHNRCLYVLGRSIPACAGEP